MSTIEKAFTDGSIAWAVSNSPVDYPAAVAAMESRAAGIANRDAAELIWLLEHPSCYTAGTSAKPEDLLSPIRFPVFETGRGGQFTYHGPGQRIIYAMLDLRRRTGGDVRVFVRRLERWLVSALKELGVDGSTDPDRVGIWVAARPPETRPGAKIAAVGLRVRKGVSLHGLSLNVSVDLDHFDGIVPCGIRDGGVTSLAALGKTTAQPQIDGALRTAFEHEFGPTTIEEAPKVHPTSPTNADLGQASVRRKSA